MTFYVGKYVHDWPMQKMMVVRNSADFCMCIAMVIYFQYPLPSLKIASLVLLRGIAYITFLALFWCSLRSCLPLGDYVESLGTLSVREMFFHFCIS
jgi:hypothetical protein